MKASKCLSFITVKSYMGTLQAALNWGHEMGYLDHPVRFKMLSVDRKEASKGRDLTTDEIKQLLTACEKVRPKDADGWKLVLQAILHSGLRLSEAMQLSWDIPNTIRPKRNREGIVVLEIPAACQKNKKDETIATIPAFVALLESIPEDNRTGWILNPLRRDGQRLNRSRQAGKVISDIGKKAGIVVNSKGKFASAHDLRRTFGQQMADAGINLLDLQAIMRHSDIKTTQSYYIKAKATEQAKRIAAQLGTVLGTVAESADEHQTEQAASTQEKT